jgi:hypothetical protein
MSSMTSGRCFREGPPHDPLAIVALFVVLIFIGVPIAFVIGTSRFSGSSRFHDSESHGLHEDVQRPEFVRSARHSAVHPRCDIMNRGKITEMLVNFCIASSANIRGGLAHANILVSMIFAGVSGSSQADTAGVGKMLIPAMIDTGYDKRTTVGVTAASSTIASSFRRAFRWSSTPASRSIVAALFIGGMIPGILIGPR